MVYPVIWSPKAKDDLKKLELDISRRIVTKVVDLERGPYHFVEKMTDVGCWKLRVGEYRVLLDILEKNKQIDVLKVGHRKKIYK